MSHNTTGPLAFPAGGHYPAGWVSPESAAAADRQAIALELALEQEAADKADREAAIDARMAERRGNGVIAAGNDPASQEAAVERL